MDDSTTWVGLDVHKESIWMVAVGSGQQVRDRGEFGNNARGLGRLVRRLKPFGSVRCAYEAGPCGYEVRRFLEKEGIPCDVVAPSLIPRKPGDRIKTDHRDAEKLARMHRMGELTTVHVPTPSQEALRDLIRAREDAKEDQLRRRHRLSKFLLRHGRKYEGRSWSVAHWNWVRSQTFEDRNAQATLREYILAIEQEAERLKRLELRIEEESRSEEVAPAVKRLRAFRGIDTLTAMTLVSELIDMNRFPSPQELMAFVGLVPREHSSGGKERRGSITKTGNAHVRRVIVEAAWHYRRVPSRAGAAIRMRRSDQPPEVIETVEKADKRLNRKFVKLVMRGKPHPVAAVAVARELVGFIWAVGNTIH